jgi:hypothetical protein
LGPTHEETPMRHPLTRATVLAVASFAGAIGLASAATTPAAKNAAPAAVAPSTRDATVTNPATPSTPIAVNPATPGAATAPTAVKPPPAGTVALKDVPDPKNTLLRAKIIDLKGNSIGSVGDIMLDASGKPASLKVDVGGFLGVGAKIVGLNADTVKWDPAKKVLVTSMTKEQLNAMPPMRS